MKYLAFAMKAVIMIIGLYMMYSFPDMSKPPFVSGLAIFLTGAYLGLQGRYGSRFSGCIFGEAKKK